LSKCETTFQRENVIGWLVRLFFTATHSLKVRVYYTNKKYFQLQASIIVDSPLSFSIFTFFERSNFQAIWVWHFSK
jgi:hypothetical protein